MGTYTIDIYVFFKELYIIFQKLLLTQSIKKNKTAWCLTYRDCLANNQYPTSRNITSYILRYRYYLPSYQVSPESLHGNTCCGVRETVSSFFLGSRHHPTYYVVLLTCYSHPLLYYFIFRLGMNRIIHY